MDPSDVLQDAFLEASRRLAEYLKGPAMPLFLWLRLVTGQKLIDIHRHQLKAQRRDPRREVQLHKLPMPEASSASLAAEIAAETRSPTQDAIRSEAESRLREVLESMDPLDREVLSLRYFEQLSNSETATVLGIEKSAASKRHCRALRKLRQALKDFPGEAP